MLRSLPSAGLELPALRGRGRRIDPGLNLDGHRMADAGAFERDLQMAADGAQPDDVTELRRAVDQLAIDRNDDVAFATPACAAEALGTTSETSAPSRASALR